MHSCYDKYLPYAINGPYPSCKSSGVKFIQPRCRKKLNPPSASAIFFPPFFFTPPCPPYYRTNAIFICSSLQLLELPAGPPALFTAPFEQFTSRGGNPTMRGTCSLFCAWSLLFLTEVCAQAQRRYVISFSLSFIFLIDSKAFVSGR